MQRQRGELVPIGEALGDPRFRCKTQLTWQCPLYTGPTVEKRNE